jgi:hypothetical protein
MRRAHHATLLHPQKLALTSQTRGCRSVDIVRSRTKASELLLTITITVLDIIHLLFETQLNCIGSSVPRAQQLNAIYGFVTVVY